jgi:hypothetical protein
VPYNTVPQTPYEPPEPNWARLSFQTDRSCWRACTLGGDEGLDAAVRRGAITRYESATALIDIAGYQPVVVWIEWSAALDFARRTGIDIDQSCESLAAGVFRWWRSHANRGQAPADGVVYGVEFSGADGIKYRVVRFDQSILVHMDPEFYAVGGTADNPVAVTDMPPTRIQNAIQLLMEDFQIKKKRGDRE